jgi:4-diphosphocytidyl-2-C-methyl-D-erythritol kinase
MARLAAPLGADVPFFVYNRPLLATGIGTDFEEVDLELPYRLELLTPSVHSSTVAAYRQLDYRQFDPGRSLRAILARPVADWPKHLVNDLEVPVFQLHPELQPLKAQLYEQGAVYAAMSGSGSAFFGLFEP